ncbi:MAG: glycosyltransferase [Deltaproteobacteria bacterium]|nr:glycosyltransferase [Deltaproteobacteria bacterium]
MRILFVTPGLLSRFGGSAVSEASLASNLQSQCELFVMCRKGKVDEKFVKKFGLQTIRQYEPTDVLRAYFAPSHPLNSIIREMDLVHINGHWRWENYFFARLCQKFSVPYVLHPRGMLVMRHGRLWLKHVFSYLLGDWIVKNSARIIALSNFEVVSFRSHPIDENQIVVIPNGIDFPNFSNENHTLSTPGPYFLYLGRLEARKNLLFLLNAFSVFSKEGGKARLVFAGPIERGYDQEIWKRARELGIVESIQIHEAIYDNSKWVAMKKALAVIYPSVDEPFGRVPFEALASGGVTIVPDASGSAEYLGRFLPSLIYKENDASSLAQIMSSLASGKVPNLEEVRNWMACELSWQRVATQVLIMYREITTSDRYRRRQESEPQSFSRTSH